MHQPTVNAIFFLLAHLLFMPISVFAWPESLPVTEAEFEARMDSFYSPLDDWRQWMEVDAESGRVKMDPEGPWIGPASTPEQTTVDFKDLEEPHVALDPGHIGGKWGPLEGRSFSVDGGPVFQEGDAVLAISKRVKELLEPYRIKISLVRDDAEPINPLRPADYLEPSVEWVTERFPDLESNSSEFKSRVTAYANRLFYRSDEIRRRADLVNGTIKPDLVVCLHINASGWPDPQKPSLVENHDLHILLHGNYTPGELSTTGARQELAYKIANSTYELEREAADAFLKIFRRATDLPAYHYGGNNALKVDEEGYLWARNLAANRLYQAPVVFLEPYVANSIEGYERIKMGDYAGRREVGEKMRMSLYEEYARATASSLIELFKLERR